MLGRMGLAFALMYKALDAVATPEEKALVDSLQKAEAEFAALDTSGMNGAEEDDAREAIYQKYGFEDNLDAAEKIGDIMEKYNLFDESVY